MLHSLPAPPRRPRHDDLVEPDPGSTSPDAPASIGWYCSRIPVRLTVTDPDALRPARRIVEAQLTAVERAAGRSRPDAEIHKLYGAAGRPITVSPLLAELVALALAAAARTDGDLDPTVAAAATALRYAGRRAGGSAADPLGGCGSSGRRRPRPAAGWEQVQLAGRRLTVPPGVTLDLSATAKAFAADRCATLVADRTGSGVLVRFGHDLATAGPAPEGGWSVLLPGTQEQGGSTIRLPAGLSAATSRAVVPDQEQRSGLLHHVLDPRTGLPPTPVWQLATVIAYSCLEANTYSTAALVRGTAALGWLRQLWVPARLVSHPGNVVTAGPWPPARESPAGLRSAGSPTLEIVDDNHVEHPAADPQDAHNRGTRTR